MGDIIRLSDRIRNKDTVLQNKDCNRKQYLDSHRLMGNAPEDKTSKDTGRLVLRTIIADPDDMDSIDDLCSQVRPGSNIFLPLYEDQIFHPEFTGHPEFYNRLIDNLKGNTIFSTTVMPLYKHCKRPQKNDWLRQIDNIFHAQFQCTRIFTINYGQNVLEDNPNWKNGQKVYIGTEEEVLHMILSIGQMAIAAKMTDDNNLEVPAVIPPYMTQSQIDFCSYISKLEESIYSVNPEKGLPKYIPTRPKNNIMSCLVKKQRFTQKMERQRSDEIDSLQDLTKRISQQYSCQDRKVHEYMPVTLEKK
ncbi:MAG: hypothetical protein V1729_06995 [Candidatus Woesearchaeota archaeon]